MTTNQNQNQAPLRITKSTLQNAAFACDILEIMGINVIDVASGKIKGPDTFTRPVMEAQAILVSDKYYRKQRERAKGDKGFNRIIAKSGVSVEVLEHALANEPHYTRFGVHLSKPTKVSCASIQDGQRFEPLDHVAQDGTRHYKFGWILDDLREVYRKMGAAQFEARYERVALKKDESVVEESGNEDQNDEE